MTLKPHQFVSAQLLRHREHGYVVIEYGMDGEPVGCTPAFATPEEADACDQLFPDPDRKHQHPNWSLVANLLRQET